MKFATSEIRTSVTILSKIYQGLHLSFRFPRFLHYWSIDEAETFMVSSVFQASEDSVESDPLLGMTFYVSCEDILKACKPNISASIFFEVKNKGTPEEEFLAHPDENGSFLRLNVLCNRFEDPSSKLSLNSKTRISIGVSRIRGAFAA